MTNEKKIDDHTKSLNQFGRIKGAVFQHSDQSRVALDLQTSFVMKYLLMLFSPFLFAAPLTCKTTSDSVIIKRSTLDQERLIYTKSISSPTLAQQELGYVSSICESMVTMINAELKKDIRNDLECAFTSKPGENISLQLVKFENGAKFGKSLIDLNDRNPTINKLYGSRIGFHTCAEIVQDYKLYLIELKDAKK